MAYSGNVRLTGSVHVDLVAGAASLVAGTNSGRFASVTDNGVGDVTVNMDADQAFSPGASWTVQPFGTIPAFSRIVPAADGLSIQVLLFDAAGAADDADFMLTLSEIFN